MAAAPKLIKRIRRDLATEIDAIWAKRSGHGEFNLDVIQSDTEALLRTKNLNDYLPEFAAALVRREDRERSAPPPWQAANLPKQFDLFTEAEAERFVLPLNGRDRVLLADATFTHLHIKQRNQIKQITIDQNRLQLFSDFIETVAQYLQAQPDATVRDVKKKLGQW